MSRRRRTWRLAPSPARWAGWRLHSRPSILLQLGGWPGRRRHGSRPAAGGAAGTRARLARGGCGRLGTGGGREGRTHHLDRTSPTARPLPVPLPRSEPGPAGAALALAPHTPSPRLLRGGARPAGRLPDRLAARAPPGLAPRPRGEAAQQAGSGARAGPRARLRHRPLPTRRVPRDPRPRPAPGNGRRPERRGHPRRRNWSMSQAAPELRWLVRPPAPPAAVAALSRALQVPPALAAMLWSRGLRDAAPDHLTPPLALSPNPALAQAANRLADAVRHGKRVLIHGDYDADGITGAAILQLGLRELGGQAETFIPNRLTDGYGVSLERVEEHAARADLFVTVDC